MEKKHVSNKPRVYSTDPKARRGGGIVLPKELLDMYDELPSMREAQRAEKQKEYVAGLSDAERANYVKASEIARAFQKKYAFKIEGNKYFPFTFNFRSAHWTVTWDNEWLTKAAKTPSLAKTVEQLIDSLSQLAPRVKDSKGNVVPLSDAAGNPVLGEDGQPLFKPNFSADKTFERK